MILNTRYTKKEFEKLLTEKLFNEFAIDIASATDEQIYRALALIARGMLSEKRKRFIARTYGANGKQVYYLCMEFLMGRSLKTSLLNLGLCGVADEVLRDYSMKLDNIYEQEPDAGLGNGGLGRLAACYLDGMATDDIPGTGYSILYEYGIFKQKIVDGWQQERADNWLPGGGVWLKSHPDQAVEVRFDGEIEESWDGVYHHVEHKNYSSVIAVPSDMYVAGYDSNGVSQLRLWQAKAPGFDMDSFNAGEYGSAITKSANAELISKVLYPNDNHIAGKLRRLRQQYFLSAASIGDIAKNHKSCFFCSFRCMKRILKYKCLIRFCLHRFCCLHGRQDIHMPHPVFRAEIQKEFPRKPGSQVQWRSRRCHPCPRPEARERKHI